LRNGRKAETCGCLLRRIEILFLGAEQLDSGLRTIVSLLGTKEEDFDSTE
jgi:hypothetical protein